VEKGNEPKIKTMVNIEIEKEGNLFQFLIPAGAPLGQAFDACMETLDVVSSWNKKAIEKAKEKAPEKEEDSGKDKTAE
jgi:hypothetical protein